jgi:hypothetical protein
MTYWISIKKIYDGRPMAGEWPRAADRGAWHALGGVTLGEPQRVDELGANRRSSRLTQEVFFLADRHPDCTS